MMGLLKKILHKFFAHNTLRMASSLAFYTSISLAPLLILFVSISSALPFDFKRYFIEEIRHLVGPQGAEIFTIVMRNAEERSDLSTLAGGLSILIMLITSGFVFGELRASLNEIFHTVGSPPPPRRSFLKEVGCFLRDNIFHIGLVLSFFLVLMASLIVSSLISSAAFFSESPAAAIYNMVISLLSYLVIFTLLYRYLPSKRMDWAVSTWGGICTAVLFLIGKELIGLYLGNSSFGSAYGAAGSLVVFSSWIYYSSIIIFFGAEMIATLRQQNIIAKAHHLS